MVSGPNPWSQPQKKRQRGMHLYLLDLTLHIYLEEYSSVLLVLN